jgi:hypothetical protein
METLAYASLVLFYEIAERFSPARDGLQTFAFVVSQLVLRSGICRYITSSTDFCILPMDDVSSLAA